MISTGVFLAPALGKMRCFRLARSSASKKQQLRRSRSCRVIEFSNLQRVELPAAIINPECGKKAFVFCDDVVVSQILKSADMCENTLPKHGSGGIQTAVFRFVCLLQRLLKGGQKLNPGDHIGDGQQARHHGGDKPPVGDLHAAAEPISCCCSSRIHGKVFCFVFWC